MVAMAMAASCDAILHRSELVEACATAAGFVDPRCSLHGLHLILALRFRTAQQYVSVITM